nr:hypothetical protein [Tanacetum cinerariifolium]
LKPSDFFNIRRQEMEETSHVTFSKDDEAISQSSTEGDVINFNEVKSFHDDEFNEPTTSDTLYNANTKYFPYVPAFDRLSTINHVSPEPIITSLPLISFTSEDSSIPNSKDIVPALDEESTKKDKAQTTQESSSKKEGDKLEQERSKKQKVEDDKESEKLKKCLEIVPDDGDDVIIDATPLSSKSPTIVDYKIYKERKKNYF